VLKALHYYAIQRNVFIAIAAVAQALFVQQFTTTISFVLVAIAGISTWLAYEYYRYKLTTTHYIIILLIALTCFVQFTMYHVAIMASTALLAWLYSNSALRNLSFIKNVVVSLCWILLNVVLQLQTINTKLVVQQFLFILALTLVYDNKDIAIDSLNKLPTLAVKLGKLNNALVALIILLINFVLQWHCNLYTSTIGFVVFVLMSIVVFIYEFKTKNIPINYYYYAVDGLIIVQLLSVINAK
jgi:4-hydroxybenzoate polyprenyltransferase